MQIIIILETFNDFFSCKLSWPQIIIILKLFKDFFSCKLSEPQIIIILKLFKNFFDSKIVLTANHHYPENIQRLFRRQKCLRRNSSLCWTYSKTFSPAKKSSTQITIILKKFKDFFACKIVLAANHLYLENIQRLFWLKNCLSRKSSLSWKHPKTFLPAKLSSTQIITMLKVFKDFFACKNVFDANHHYPETIQRLFRLQYCLRCKSSLSWKHWKIFSLANLS